MEINENSDVEEIISIYPNLVNVFIRLGSPCLVCGDPFWGTVKELAGQYNVDIEILVEQLNREKDKKNEKI